MDNNKPSNNIIEDLISENKILSCKLFLKYETAQIETTDGMVINIKPANLSALFPLEKISVVE